MSTKKETPAKKAPATKKPVAKKATPEKVPATPEEVVTLEELFNERKEALQKVENYVTAAVAKLEQRPEEVRRELMKELKIIGKHNQQLLTQIQQLNQKFDSDRKIFLAEIDYLKRSLQEQKAISNSRRYL